MIPRDQNQLLVDRRAESNPQIMISNGDNSIMAKAK